MGHPIILLVVISEVQVNNLSILVYKIGRFFANRKCGIASNIKLLVDRLINFWAFGGVFTYKNASASSQ
jgi:hypothetical protein